MSPPWNPIADEAASLAADRALAARHEPDPDERHLLLREARLLERAAAAARARPDDDDRVRGAAHDGLAWLHGGLPVWFITAEAEDALRALALDGPHAPDSIDGRTVLRAILGAPVDPERRASVVV